MKTVIFVATLALSFNAFAGSKIVGFQCKVKDKTNASFSTVRVTLDSSKPTVVVLDNHNSITIQAKTVRQITADGTQHTVIKLSQEEISASGQHINGGKVTGEFHEGEVGHFGNRDSRVTFAPIYQ